jgi:hypothetical protein
MYALTKRGWLLKRECMKPGGMGSLIAMLPMTPSSTSSLVSGSSTRMSYP